tara:strand:+ start:86 stop:682 length:597 start_codon:yes stop_codon:yes gene_type:complete
MKELSDLKIGVAGEYLVCADLILSGYDAFKTEQGMPYDIVLDVDGALIKVQVKTTRAAKEIPQRKTSIPAYIFNIGTNGKGGKRKKYDSNQVDLFALVCLDTKSIAYLPHVDCKSTMNFRVPLFRGKYHDEQSEQIKEKVLEYKKAGYSADYIANTLGMKLSNVYRYQANVSIKQKGTNAGVYFDCFDLENALKKIIL